VRKRESVTDKRATDELGNRGNKGKGKDKGKGKGKGKIIGKDLELRGKISGKIGKNREK